MTKADLDVLLEELVLREGSDLHLRFGEPPMMRVTGSLQKMETNPLDDNDLKELIYGLMNEQQQAQFEADHEFDMAYEISGVARFRGNVFRKMGHMRGVSG